MEETMKGELNSERFFNMLAFWALVISGFVLVLTKILAVCGITWVGLGVLNTIAYILSFVVMSIAAYNYVRTRQSTVWIVVYVIAVLLAFVPLIINLF